MLRRVRLEVARSQEFPDGSRDYGYELVLPLTADGHLDHATWLKHRNDAVFRRFWGREQERGQLKHDGRGWFLDFEPGVADDQVFIKADVHRFKEGEYVSIKERDGVTRTFRVAVIR